MPLVMGVLNVTPDSFYDGGRWQGAGAAVEHGLEMFDQGADIVDVGGESTRPGAHPVDEAEEARRVVPVVAALAGQLPQGRRLSVDTRKPAVAEAALDAGACIVNDVSASLWPVAARNGAGWVAMHMRGAPADMSRYAHYGDVVLEVKSFLAGRAALAREAGVGEVWVDPGIGFAKSTRHNLELLARLPELVATGWPVAIGTSRKRFTGVAGRTECSPAPPEERLEASLATAVWAMASGAAMVRVHDVKATADAARLVGAS